MLVRFKFNRKHQLLKLSQLRKRDPKLHKLASYKSNKLPMLSKLTIAILMKLKRKEIVLDQQELTLIIKGRAHRMKFQLLSQLSKLTKLKSLHKKYNL
jgi:hypothetical protein